MSDPARDLEQLKFRDPVRARAMVHRLGELMAAIGRAPVTLMHVCGSHEQAIARFGLRSALPEGLDVIMGPGCPVCVTDMPEVDEAVELAGRSGVHVATYGDMLRVPGTRQSLADAQAAGGRVHVVYSVSQAVELARELPGEEVVFFASGFETTAVATAAVVLTELPPNFSVLSAHKYIPPAMEIVAGIPESRVEGFLAAGHAATITGWAVFEEVAERHRLPVVVAGFEPLDILAAMVRLVEMVRDGAWGVVNMFPRCVTRAGNRPALAQLWRVFEPAGGRWRGIAEVPEGNLRLRPEWAHLDARHRFRLGDAVSGAAFSGAAFSGTAASGTAVSGIPLAGEGTGDGRESLAARCVCGAIMSGLATPLDCPLFGRECTADRPVGACMVSSEGTCKIWHLYGGRPDLRPAAGQPVEA